MSALVLVLAGGFGAQQPLPLQLVEQLARDDRQVAECVAAHGVKKVAEEALAAFPADLNGDGVPELMVDAFRYLENCNTCGARRCHVWVYGRTSGGFVQLLDGGFILDSLNVFSSRTNGYADLELVYIGGLNYASTKETWRFDGHAYVKPVAQTYGGVFQQQNRWSNADREAIALGIGLCVLVVLAFLGLSDFFVSSPSGGSSREADGYGGGGNAASYAALEVSSSPSESGASQEGQASGRCPDCDSIKIFSGLGDGVCSYCHGSGVGDLFDGLADATNPFGPGHIKCHKCGGNGQCTTCGGTGEA